MVVHCVVEADAVDTKVLNPVETDVTHEFLRAGIPKIQVLEPRERASKCAGVGAVLSVSVEVLIREVRTDMVEHAIHDHMETTSVTGGHQSLEPGELLSRVLQVVRVAVFNSEVLEWLV